MKSKSEIISISQNYFDGGYACSQSVLLAFAPHFDLDEQTAKLISSTFGGGMGRLRLTCGAVTGSFMVLGLAYGNCVPNDMKTKLKSYSMVREFNRRFIQMHGTSSCSELLEKHASEADVSERKHHKLICRKVVADAAGLVYDMLMEEESVQTHE